MTFEEGMAKIDSINKICNDVLNDKYTSDVELMTVIEKATEDLRDITQANFYGDKPLDTEEYLDWFQNKFLAGREAIYDAADKLKKAALYITEKKYGKEVVEVFKESVGDKS